MVGNGAVLIHWGYLSRELPVRRIEQIIPVSD
jgi:hypothetical protein